ncbi:MAG: hypothetical protein H6681_02680 [Desulfobacteraceae bacterium]|nr:hypothetical protein [Desulfobacteraceae bacterium]MCB9494333.1 hypothetical protein [Desulfobacteraceae bacterium]
MKHSKIFQTTIIIFFILSSHGCDNKETTKINNDKILTSARSIGPEGGEVELEFSQNRAVAIFPENALNNFETIRIKRQTTLPSPLETQAAQAGDCINFSPEGIIFNKNITLGIPYFEDLSESVDKIGIKYFDPIQGKWTEISVKHKDTDKKIVYFETNHFSNYISYIEDELPYYPNNELVKGEYFTGRPYYYTNADGTTQLRVKGCINRKDLMCGEPWHLSMFLHNGNQIIKIIDRFFTLNHLSGYPAELSEDGSFITFDSFSMFPKVLESGDARLWDWQCEFVKEHTTLLNYEVYSDDDPQFIQDQAGEKVYAKISAVDQKNVKIEWDINIIPQLKPGKILSIRFEARYNPDE